MLFKIVFDGVTPQNNFPCLNQLPNVKMKFLAELHTKRNHKGHKAASLMVLY